MRDVCTCPKAVSAAHALNLKLELTSAEGY